MPVNSLLIDCGNTAVKFRLKSQGNCRDLILGHDELSSSSKITEMLTGLEVNRICIACVASVQVERSLVNIITEQMPDIEVELLQPQAAWGGLVNRYKSLDQLGVDRWLVAIAAFHHWLQDIIVVDAGSAINIELVSKDEGYLGGAILPGLNMDENRFKALFPHLKASGVAKGQKVEPGLNTKECLMYPSGTGLLDCVDELLHQWADKLNDPKIVLTGQDAVKIQNSLKLETQIVDDLVFLGMGLLCQS